MRTREITPGLPGLVYVALTPRPQRAGTYYLKFRDMRVTLGHTLAPRQIGGDQVVSLEEQRWRNLIQRLHMPNGIDQVVTTKTHPSLRHY